VNTTNTRKRAHSLAAIGICAAAAAIAGCSGGSKNQQVANGTVDSAATATSAIVNAEGPGVQVTRTDQASLNKSTEYKLTADNFGKFMAAADSLTALVNRDSSARAYLSSNITDAGARSADAGLQWLEANATVNNAIASAGISTRDYFVQSIAIASAERFMQDPKSAPPTPTASENAEFLRGHQADLTRLQAMRMGKSAVVSTP
jgi:hypothetical protein